MTSGNMIRFSMNGPNVRLFQIQHDMLALLSHPIEKGYVVSGVLNAGVPTNDLWIYDALNDNWTSGSDIPGPPRHRATAYSMSYEGFVFGGADAAFTPLADSWRYQVVGDYWAPMAELIEPRWSADAAPFGIVSAVVLGGATSDTTFSSAVSIYFKLPDTCMAFTTFPPGPRRGGVSGDLGWPGETCFYGLGLDEGLQRHNDWWKLEYSLGVPDEPVNAAFSLFPNPGTDSFSLSGAGDASMLTIADAQGRIVFVLDDLDDQRIDATDWRSGIYIITAIDESGASYRARWIKL